MSDQSCWNTIGVWGTERPRCHLLDQVVHCRNCEVFVQAGRHLLDRGVSPEEQAEAAQRLADRSGRGAGELESIMVFELGSERLAVSSSVMQAVVSTRPVHTVPHRSNATFLGLVAIRGRLKLCISLPSVLGVQTGESDQDETRMLVVNYREEEFVFPVDRVVGIQRRDSSKIAEAGTETSAVHSSCLRGVLDQGDRPISLLDSDRLWELIRQEVGL